MPTPSRRCRSAACSPSLASLLRSRMGRPGIDSLPQEFSRPGGPQSRGANVYRSASGRSLPRREQAAGDLGDLDLVRAGIDLEDLGVAAQLLDLEFGHVAVA